VAGEGSPLLLLLRICRVEVGLVDVVVFSTNVELVSLFLRELHGVNIDFHLVDLVGHTLVLCVLEQAERHFRITQLSLMPLANLGVVGDRNDVVSILSTNYSHRVDGVLVAVLSENTLLHRGALGSDIPLHDVAALG